MDSKAYAREIGDRCMGKPLTSLTRLIASAMRACDFYGDDQAARDAMREACADTPLELRADLLQHFSLSYPKGDQP